MNKNQKVSSTVLFSFAAIPLLIYPFVVVANLMTIAGNQNGSELITHLVVVYTFIALTFLYPVIYVVCLLTFVLTRQTNKKLLLAKIPLGYILLCLCFLGIWSVFS